MQRAALCLMAALGVAAIASADTPGFIQTDLAKAKSEALATGKLVFIYFNLPG